MILERRKYRFFGRLCFCWATAKNTSSLLLDAYQGFRPDVADQGARIFTANLGFLQLLQELIVCRLASLFLWSTQSLFFNLLNFTKINRSFIVNFLIIRIIARLFLSSILFWKINFYKTGQKTCGASFLKKKVEISTERGTIHRINSRVLQVSIFSAGLKCTFSIALILNARSLELGSTNASFLLVQKFY